MRLFHSYKKCCLLHRADGERWRLRAERTEPLSESFIRCLFLVTFCLSVLLAPRFLSSAGRAFVPLSFLGSKFALFASLFGLNWNRSTDGISLHSNNKGAQFRIGLLLLSKATFAHGRASADPHTCAEHAESAEGPERTRLRKRNLWIWWTKIIFDEVRNVNARMNDNGAATAFPILCVCWEKPFHSIPLQFETQF